MAIDSVYKRMSATISFPHAVGVWPAGSVDRYAATWIYTGPIASPPGVLAIPEILDGDSTMWTALAKISEILTTLSRNSNL